MASYWQYSNQNNAKIRNCMLIINYTIILSKLDTKWDLRYCPTRIVIYSLAKLEWALGLLRRLRKFWEWRTMRKYLWIPNSIYANVYHPSKEIRQKNKWIKIINILIATSELLVSKYKVKVLKLLTIYAFLTNYKGKCWQTKQNNWKYHLN